MSNQSASAWCVADRPEEIETLIIQKRSLVPKNVLLFEKNLSGRPWPPPSTVIQSSGGPKDGHVCLTSEHLFTRVEYNLVLFLPQSSSSCCDGAETEVLFGAFIALICRRPSSFSELPTGWWPLSSGRRWSRWPRVLPATPAEAHENQSQGLSSVCRKLPELKNSPHISLGSTCVQQEKSRLWGN